MVFDRYFFIKLAIGFVLGSVIIWSTPFAEGRINPAQEFCGDKYCGHYGVPSEVKKIKHVKRHKGKKTVVYKAKHTQVASADYNDNPVMSAGSNLVAAAKSYLGTNPTGWSRVWCGRFMALIAPEAARRIKNPNWARDWADLPRTAPRVGAIAVLTRGRGGHVGVVSGFDNRGNPIIISGNHNRRVGEAIYSKHRVIAYVNG